MTKVNVSLDDDVKAELFRLVPSRKRSQVINEALRKELLHRKRTLAADKIHRLRKKSATLGSKDILDAIRKDRARRA